MTNAYAKCVRRAQRGSSEYLIDLITERQLAATDGRFAQWSRSAELDALPGIAHAATFATLPLELRLANYYRDVVGRHYREIAEIMACCDGSRTSRLRRGRQRLRTVLRSRHEWA
jgi:RNA polymerase sigma-70 factor (ECF subfamily)